MYIELTFNQMSLPFYQTHMQLNGFLKILNYRQINIYLQFNVLTR